MIWYSCFESGVISMYVADKLKECREEKKLSQEDLLFELGKLGLRLSRQTLGSWESGTTAPDVNDLAIIAKFFNKPVQYFFALKQ